MKILFVDLVKILHSGEGGDVEQWLEPRNKLLVFVIGLLIAFHYFTFLSYDTTCFIVLISFTCIFGLYSFQQESNYAP